MSDYKFSLIVATINRKQELVLFLESLTNQLLPSSQFEVILVDQNTTDLIQPIIKSFENKLNINHIKSAQKGLSYNRNIGIKASKGEYLCVPDDDCTYYPDTLYMVLKQLEALDKPDMVIGKVFDRERNKYVFKKTPNKSLLVNESNFYNIVSSITIFFKKNEILFDENFGIGTKYASNEDGVFILSFVKEDKRVIYSPLIDCNHPPYSPANMSKQKLFEYGVGFGAMCRKFSSFNLQVLFFKVIFYQIFMMMRFSIVMDKENVSRRWQSLKGRILGFKNYQA
jgi:glycosyltransferase involved in cell wall biosynthesis